MNTNNYDNEATRFPESVNEETDYKGATPAGEQKPRVTPPPIPASAKTDGVQKVVVTPATRSVASASKKSSGGGSAAKNVALGAGAGILMGTAATVLMGMKNANDPIEPVDGDNNDNEANGTHPAWSDGDVSVATSVNDSMSFSEAFAAARAEVGPGGAFEWHGGVYGTYYASEWNSMSAAEKTEYGSHFSWNNAGSTSHHSATTHHTTVHHTTHAHSGEVAATGTDPEPGIGGIDDPSAGNDPKPGTGGDDGVNVVSVNHGHISSHVSTQTSTQTTTQTTTQTSSHTTESGVEVIGVFHDDGSGYNVGVMNVNDHTAMVIDVDGDLKFDVLAVDMNNDGQFSEDEMVTMEDSNLTVADLGGFTAGAGDGSEVLVAERGVSGDHDVEVEPAVDEIEEFEAVETSETYTDTDIDGLPATNPNSGVYDPYNDYDPNLTDNDNLLADDGMIDTNMDGLV